MTNSVSSNKPHNEPNSTVNRTTHCPVCESDVAKPFLDVPNFNFSSRVTSASIMQCERCGLCYLSPFPTLEDIHELYKVDQIFSRKYENPYASKPFFRQFEALYRQYGDDTRFIVRTALSLVRRNPEILDIGCSSGGLLARFHALAPKAGLTGIDIDPGARESAPPSLRDRIWIGDLLDYPTDRQFDIVTMRFVIEHLMHPIPYLEKIRFILKPDGCLFMSTPDIDSPLARSQGASWNMISQPNARIGHCLWHTHQSMERMLRQAGFSIVRISNRGPAIDHFPAFLQQLIPAVLGRDPISDRPIANFHLRILWAVIIDGFLAERFGWGDQMYVFAKPISP